MPGVARAVTLVLLASLAAWRGAAGQDSIAVPSTFTLTGRIVDALNERPVISAVVKLPELQRYVFSDVNGRFTIREFPAGTWEVVVEMLGYHTLEGSFTVAEGNGLVLRLNPDPVALEGLRVQTRADGLLDRRRRRYPYRVDHISPQNIANAINPDPVAIFSRYTRVPLRSCYWGPIDMAFGCYDRRGRVRGDEGSARRGTTARWHDGTADVPRRPHSLDGLGARGRRTSCLHQVFHRTPERFTHAADALRPLRVTGSAQAYGSGNSERNSRSVRVATNGTATVSVTSPTPSITPVSSRCPAIPSA